MRAFIETTGRRRAAASSRETRRRLRTLSGLRPSGAACTLVVMMAACCAQPVAAASSAPGERLDRIIVTGSDARQKVVAIGTVLDTGDPVFVVERSPKAPLKDPDRAAIRTLLDRFNDMLSRTNAVWKDRTGASVPIPLFVGLSISNGDFWFGFDTVSEGRRVNEALLQGPVASLSHASLYIRQATQAAVDAIAERDRTKPRPTVNANGLYVVSVTLKMASRSASVSFVPVDPTTATNLSGSLAALFRSLFIAAGMIEGR